MAKNTAVFAIFKDRFAVESAVDTLKTGGYRNSDISVLFPDNEGSLDFAHEKSTKAPEGATTGASTGAVIGGALGWLVGIGSLAIPGIGPFVAAGPIMAALAGAGVGGAVGGVTGALIGMGIPEFEAKRYEGMVKDGGILVSVHCDESEWVDRAKEILKTAGGQDVSSTSESDSNVIEGTEPRDPKLESNLYASNVPHESITTPMTGAASYNRSTESLKDRDLREPSHTTGL